MNKKPIIIFDLDGTLANCEHRKHWITSKPKNWKAFFKGIKGDTPIIPVMSVLTSLLKSNYNIIFMSGRSEDTREDTVQWLNDQNIHKDAHYIDLLMRKSNDFRSDDIVKSEILDEIEKDYDILFAFDDRPKVVRMLRNRGIFVFDVYQGTEDF